MKVDDLDFYDCDADDDVGFLPTSKEACLRIVRHAAHKMCSGAIPGEIGLRLGLLFSVVAKLAITCEEAVSEAKSQSHKRDHRAIEDKANHTMAMIVAAATMWAEAAAQGCNVVSSFGDD